MKIAFYKILYFILICPLFAGCADPVSSTPDMIIHHANIYTVNQDKPTAEAIAIRHGRIVAIGTNQEMVKLGGDSTVMIDAKGYFLMPGFIEGHGHFSGLGKSLQNLNLLHTRSWDETLDLVAAKASSAKPGEWIIGRGWHQEKWTEPPVPNEQGYPYHHSLSTLSPLNPVLLEHASGHALFANKAAMDAAGVTSETSDPKGGRIVRGDGNEAIGVFEENAQDILEDAYRQYLTTLTQEEIEKKWYEAIRLAQDECLKKGVTSFQDAGSSIDEINKLADLAQADKLDIRIWMMIRHTSEYLKDKLSAFPKTGIGNDFFTSRAIKISIDGALGSYGAWLLEPYTDYPGFTGQNTSTLEELSALADLCLQYDLQLCTHAIGDRANREALNLYEDKFSRTGVKKDFRWRIEHAQHLHPDDIPRFGKLGVIACMQGIHCTSDAPFVEKRLGAARARSGAYAWRSLLDNGAIIANGTDTPVEDIDPLTSFYATVTRTRIDNGLEFYPEQALSREEAIHSYTLANAYAAFEEKVKGSLEPGKYADLVILNKNLLSCTESEILETKVLLTMVNGDVKFRHADF